MKAPAIQKRLWVRTAVGFLLLCQLQATSILDRTLYGEWMGKSGDKLTQFIMITQIIIAGTLFVRGLHQWKGIRKTGLITIYMTIFLMFSAAWSVSSGATLRAGVQYLIMLLGLAGATRNLEEDDFMDLLSLVCFWSAVISILLLVLSPHSAYGEAGDFRGIFSRKNPLGEALSTGALATLHGLRKSRRKRLSRMAMLPVMIFVTLKSGSATSLLAIGLFILVGAVLERFPNKRIHRVC